MLGLTSLSRSNALSPHRRAYFITLPITMIYYLFQSMGALAIKIETDSPADNILWSEVSQIKIFICFFFSLIMVSSLERL